MSDEFINIEPPSPSPRASPSLDVRSFCVMSIHTDLEMLTIRQRDEGEGRFSTDHDRATASDHSVMGEHEINPYYYVPPGYVYAGVYPGGPAITPQVVQVPQLYGFSSYAHTDMSPKHPLGGRPLLFTGTLGSAHYDRPSHDVCISSRYFGYFLLINCNLKADRRVQGRPADSAQASSACIPILQVAAH